MSILRRNERRTGRRERAGRKARTRLELLLFRRVPAPNAECERERRELERKWRDITKQFRATGKDAELWAYLAEQRDEYDPKVNGPSRVFDVVDSVLALREVEREILAEQKVAPERVQPGEPGPIEVQSMSREELAELYSSDARQSGT